MFHVHVNVQYRGTSNRKANAYAGYNSGVDDELKRNHSCILPAIITLTVQRIWMRERNGRCGQFRRKGYFGHAKIEMKPLTG